ncbi:MAG: class I SAM-dependent methyltransferase [Candidatus Kuenenbacteria bacterium]
MQSFDHSWEKNIYSQGKHINSYPYDLVVSLVANNFFTIPKNKRKKIKILDLGCGAGNNSRFLAENGFATYGVDGSATAIKICQQKFKKLNLKGDFKRADFLRLPYKDNFFDLVLDRQSLYANKIVTIQKTIDEIFAKLRKGGLFISFMYSRSHPDIKFGKKNEPGTYSSFSKRSSFYRTKVAHFVSLREIKKLFSKFKIESIHKHLMQQSVSNKKNSSMEFSEYIIIARKI